MPPKKRARGGRRRPDLPGHTHELRLRALCPAPDWRAAFIRRRRDGRWAIELEAVLAFGVVRHIVRRSGGARARDSALDYVAGFTATSLTHLSSRGSLAGLAEDLALPENTFLGYLAPGETLGEHHRLVASARTHAQRIDAWQADVARRRAGRAEGKGARRPRKPEQTRLDFVTLHRLQALAEQEGLHYQSVLARIVEEGLSRAEAQTRPAGAGPPVAPPTEGRPAAP